MRGKPSRSRRLYGWLLRFFPAEHRARMQESMLQTFDDLRREDHSFKALFNIFTDTFIAVIKESVMVRQSTNKLALYSLILLIPFGLLFVISGVWQVMNWLGFAGTPHASAIIPYPDLAYWLIFIAPAAAVLLNAGIITTNAVRVGPRAVFSMQFAKTNAITLGVFVLAAGATVFIFGHDAIPCFLRGLLNGGWGNFSPLIQACLKAKP